MRNRNILDYALNVHGVGYVCLKCPKRTRSERIMTEHLKVHGITLETDEGMDQSGEPESEKVKKTYVEQQKKSDEPKIQQAEQQEKDNQPITQQAEPQKHDHLTLIVNSVHNASKALMVVVVVVIPSAIIFFFLLLLYCFQFFRVHHHHLAY